MSSLNKLASAVLLTAGLLATPAPAQAQKPTNPGNIDTKTSDTATATPMNLSKDQMLTATVHQAWLLSGKNEANFFEIVEQLAQISAANRGISLPDSEAAGRKIGNYIKTSAKADTDQLLYAVVDKAVRMTSPKPVHAAGAPRPGQ